MNRRNNLRDIRIKRNINMIEVHCIYLGRDTVYWWALVIKAMSFPIYIKDGAVLFHLSI